MHEMNATRIRRLRATKTCYGRENDESSWNATRRKSRRRNRFGILFAAAALCGNTCHRAAECEAFVVPTSHTRHSSLPLKISRRDGPELPHSKRTRTRMRVQSNNLFGNNRTIDDGWEADVYEDLEKLERAITLEDADLKLEHSILKEQVEFIDQSKKLVIPNVLRNIVTPLIYSWGLFKLLSSGKTGIRKMVGGGMIQAMDLYFWMVVVGGPILLKACRSIAKIKGKPIYKPPFEDEIPGMERVYMGDTLSPAAIFQFGEAYDLRVPSLHCEDTVGFMLEYWTSAVNGMAVLFAIKTFAKAIGIPLFRSSAAMLWLSILQFVTRLAAVASLFQFPEKLYELERMEETRPVGIFPTWLLKLVESMMTIAPIGLICDFSKILLHCPKGWITPLYACIIVSLAGTWARMRESVASSSQKDPLAPSLLKPPKPLAKLVYGFSYLALWRKQLSWKAVADWVDIGVVSGSNPIVFWKGVILGSLLFFPILGPLVHLKAISKIFHVEYSNDLPSLSTKESYEKAIKERPERAYDMAWRFSLRWRKPKPLGYCVYLVYEKIYRLLFMDSRRETIYKDECNKIEEHLLSGRTVQERLNEELELDPKRLLLFPDRDNFKQVAMDLQEKLHTANYEKALAEDPLGMAMHRSFGAKLGFNFDHMYELKGEDPSPRRLQARACKSALGRYNKLYDAEKALEAKIATLEDPKEKERYQKLLEKHEEAFDEEIEFLAGRLQELVPTSMRPEEAKLNDESRFRSKLPEQYRGDTNYYYKKISATEYRRFKEDPFGSDEPSVRDYIV